MMSTMGRMYMIGRNTVRIQASLRSSCLTALKAIQAQRAITTSPTVLAIMSGWFLWSSPVWIPTSKPTMHRMIRNCSRMTNVLCILCDTVYGQYALTTQTGASSLSIVPCTVHYP